MFAVLTTFAVFSGVLLALTGIFLALTFGTDASVQVTQLTHVVVGIAALLPMAWVTIRHARRGRTGLALLTGLVLVLANVSGLVVAGAAAFGPASGGAALGTWPALLHLWTGLGLIGVTVAHVGAAAYARKGVRWIRNGALPSLLTAGIALAGILAAGSWLQSRDQLPTPATYDMPFGDGSPFAPANTRVTGESFLAPQRLAGSAMCGTCHKAIYEQWSQSMHRYAATDPHVETGIRWFQRENGAAAGRLCAGCHNPIMLLAGRFDSATTPLEGGTAAHPEGISCLSCHAITAIHEDPLGNGSYVITPPDKPLVSGPLANTLIRMDPAAHAASMIRRPLFESAKFCASCHQQYIPTELDGPGPSDVENQYPEWLASEYADGQACNSCHMPLVEADDPAAVDGKIHSHRFVGANHAHAVASGHEEQARLTLEFMRDAIIMTVNPTNSEKPGHVGLQVAVTNEGAGHRFPSGTTDISQVWLEVIVGERGVEKKPLLASGLLDEQHYLDPEAHVYRKVIVDVANVPVDLHNLALMDKTTTDTFIAPGATDKQTFNIPVGQQRSGQVPVRVRLRMRKANQRWTDWLTNFDGTTVTVTDILTEETTLDLSKARVLAPVSELPPGADVPGPPIPGMAWIPPSEMTMGLDDGDADEAPMHTRYVDGFYMDRYPVTNLRYRRFLRTAGGIGPVHNIGWAKRYSWTGIDYPEGNDDMPVVLVLQEDAKRYCKHMGKRLPTEPEWEKAARGSDGRRYPWGNRWEDGACEVMDGVDIPPRVGMCPNRASPYGVQDTVGGVWEWTGSPYMAYDRLFLHPNANDWINTFGDVMVAVRGVPAGQVGPHTTAASRVGQADNQRQRVGFRCAKDAPKQTATTRVQKTTVQKTTVQKAGGQR